MKYKGRNVSRLAHWPEERRFAEAWSAENEKGHILAHLLDSAREWPNKPAVREHEVAATVIQWLGTMGGRVFLLSLGYVKEPIPADEQEYLDLLEAAGRLAAAANGVTHATVLGLSDAIRALLIAMNDYDEAMIKSGKNRGIEEE